MAEMKDFPVGILVKECSPYTNRAKYGRVRKAYRQCWGEPLNETVIILQCDTVKANGTPVLRGSDHRVIVRDSDDIKADKHGVIVINRNLN